MLGFLPSVLYKFLVRCLKGRLGLLANQTLFSLSCLDSGVLSSDGFSLYSGLFKLRGLDLSFLGSASDQYLEFPVDEYA